MESKIYINRIMMYPNIGLCNVKFKNGLNVIWSKDCRDEDDLKQKSLRNSVGKTTFIKLMDYILGLNYFITTIDDRKKELFGNRCALAEVNFGDEKFTIKRDIIDNDKIEIFDGWIIDNIVSGNSGKSIENFNLQDYLNFLNEKIYRGCNVINEKVYVTHRRIMSILIRNQSVGFIKYNSGIKEEHAKDRMKRLEFLLALISEKRELLEKDIETLKKDKSKLINEKNILKKYFELTSEKKSKDLIKEKLDNKKQITAIEREQENKKGLLNELQLESRKCENNGQEIEHDIKNISEEIYILKEKEKEYELAVKDIENEIYKINNINLAIEIFTPFPVRRCPIYLKELNGEKGQCEYLGEAEKKSNFKEMTEARKKILMFEKKDIKSAISKAESYSRDLNKQKDKLEKEILKNNELKDDIKVKIQEQFGEVNDKIKDLKYKNIMIDKELKNFEHIETLKADIAIKTDGINIKKESLNKIIRNRATELNTIYTKIVQYITENNRIGKINQKDYSPQIYYSDGTIDMGSAMGNVAVIAFDLAILEMSLNYDDVSNVYPKFLIHDSPKLHDIQLEIYKKIIDYVIEMEVKYGKQGKEFQYILTTLDISDKVELNKEMYIRLTLDNSGEGGKLFGCQIEVD